MNEKTVLLYDGDAYLTDFDARVLDCRARVDGHCDVVLDRTAFFPEQGGQTADTGLLDGHVRVLDAHISQGVVVHRCDGPLTPGAGVRGRIDFEHRFSHMQQHTGEHICSGLAYRRFGCRNVGFHLSDRAVTMDYDLELSAEQLSELEECANRAVWDDRPVRCWYPTAQEAQALDYRSKKEIGENLRIVSIEGVDDCACCAPHVRRTGEIGLIKIMNAIRYKGGMRLSILCGRRALSALDEKQRRLRELSLLMTCGEEDLTNAFLRRQEEMRALRERLSAAETALVTAQARSAAAAGTPYLMTDVRDEHALLEASAVLSNGLKKPCLVFSGSDSEGYRLILRAQGGGARRAFDGIKAALDARGGGDDELIRGRTAASAERIRAFYAGETH